MNYKIYASNPAREKSEERSYETRELMIDDFNKLLHESEKKNRQVHHSMITKRNEEMILAVVVECEHADFETIDLGGTDETITICHSCGKEL